MPDFEVTSPQGVKYRVTGPEGSSEQDAIDYLQQHRSETTDEGAGEALTTSVGNALSGAPVIGRYVPQVRAGIRAAIHPLTGIGEEGDTYEERYQKELALAQERLARAQEAHPWASAAGKVAGGTLALAPAAGSAVGARLLGMAPEMSLGGRVLASGASGAAISAADAAAGGEDPWTAAGVGGGIGAALPLVGYGLGRSGASVRRLFEAPPTRPTARVGSENVGLTYGQATGNVKAQQAEYGAARGVPEAPETQAAQQRFAQQEQEIERARAGAVPGPIPVQDPLVGAGIAAQGVRSSEAASKAGYRTQYQRAYGEPGEFQPGTFDQTGQSIRQRMATSQNPVMVLPETTPVADRMLRHVDENFAAPPANRARPIGGAYDNFTMGNVDQMRRQLLAMARSTQYGSEDQRAARAVIGAFDQHVQSAMENGLFSGSDQALENLKQARAMYAAHQQTYTPQFGGDRVGNAMRKIIGYRGQQGANPAEVASYLWGKSGTGESGLSVALVNRMKAILGANSPEFNAIQQGMWQRLTKNFEGATDWGPQKITNSLAYFLNGHGEPLANELFTPTQLNAMREYMALQQQLIPKQGAVNYSNTAAIIRPAVERAGQKVWHHILAGGLGAVGITHGNPLLLAGAGLAEAAPVIHRLMQQRAQLGRLRRSLAGFNPDDRTFANQMARYGAIAAKGAAAPAAQEMQ